MPDLEEQSCLFQDRALGETKVIGTGYDSLFVQLENRVQNVRRPLTHKPTKRPADAEGRQGGKVNRYSDCYGCVEWQPVLEGSLDELEDKKAELKNAFKNNNNLPEMCVKKLMKETYAIQRSTINQGSCVNVLLEEWPYLFEVVHLFDHTSTLLAFPVQKKLVEEISKKGKTIKDFFKMKGVATESMEQPLQLISCVAKHFKECPEILIIQNKVGNFSYFVF